MHKILPVIFIIIWILLVAALSGNAQTGQPNQPLTRILFVFDGSQSMMGNWDSDKKINVARNILKSMVDSLQQVDNVELALRVYGHQSIVPPQDCSDTRLEVPFGRNNGQQIKDKLSKIDPKGTTPIAKSLELAASDFTACDNCRNI
ncbi:MAG: vWA domain-containing protein, partial [Bacteroidota bacterium]